MDTTQLSRVWHWPPWRPSRWRAAGAADAPNTLTAAEKAAGWRLLFDGSSTAGWRGYNKPDTSGLRWVVKDGAVCLPPADGADTRGHRDIITADTFGDFDLTWQWQVQPGSNSGLKYFVVESGDAAIGHEYQIIDDARHADAKISTERQTASFYDVKSATARPTKPIGEWNTSRVLVQGNHVEHWLNGAKVLEYELGSPEILGRGAGQQVQDECRLRHEEAGPHPAAGPRRCGVLSEREGAAGHDVGIADCRLRLQIDDYELDRRA